MANSPSFAVDCIVGARPNFIKIAAILQALDARPAFKARLIHTGQHFSPEMSQNLFDDLGIRVPDLHLDAAVGTATAQTAATMVALERAFLDQRPDLVLVVGDVNSTLAAALVAAKLLIPIAHVEAGLRSGDRAMPEEINRILTDAISDYLFVSEPSGIDNLAAEGVPADRVFFTGNVMIDTLLRFRDRAATSTILSQLALEPRRYAVVTMHRPANVDNTTRLGAFLAMLRDLSSDIPIVFPVHPRTRERIESARLDTGAVRLTAPLGYTDFLHLTANACIVLTDSGGIQEETTILRVACLTMRENTERPVTISHGSNRLVGVEPAAILAAAREVLANPPASDRVPELWDGRASERIVDILTQVLEARMR